jgi:hypothetical protein
VVARSIADICKLLGNAVVTCNILIFHLLVLFINLTPSLMFRYTRKEENLPLDTECLLNSSQMQATVSRLDHVPTATAHLHTRRDASFRRAALDPS